MDKAFELAQKAAQMGEVPVGAVVVQRDIESGLGECLIGSGFNQREQLNDPLGHAEVIALREASQCIQNWRLSDCILVVTLEPCLMCLAACQQARISEVIYGAMDRKGGACSLGYHFYEDSRIHHRLSVQFLNRPECGEILTDFFRLKVRNR